MTLEGNSTEHVGVVALFEDPDHLQPFYLMLVTSSLKLMLTVIVFKVDSLKPPEVLHEEWRRDDAFSRVKRVAGICMQVLFIALALNTFVADVRAVVSSARDHNVWQVYTCFVVTWTTSPNLVAAFTVVTANTDIVEVLKGTAKHIDPRPFGKLHKVAFYLKVAYCIFLGSLYGNAELIGCLSHAIVGAATYTGISFYEGLKFIFFAFWRDIFTGNLKLLAEDARLLWTFSYPDFIGGVGACLFASPLACFVYWWHEERDGHPRYQPLDLVVEEQNGRQEEEAQESSETPAAEYTDSPEPAVMQRPIKAFFVGAAIVSPMFYQITVLIAARVYQGDGVYPAIIKTVSERTLQRYVARTWADLSATGASMQYRVDMVLRAIWAWL